jgi:hypothetical protein
MEYVSCGLEAVNIALGFTRILVWPLLVGFAIWMFRKEVRGLLDRFVKFKGYGLEAEASLAQDATAVKAEIEVVGPPTNPVKDATEPTQPAETKASTTPARAPAAPVGVATTTQSGKDEKKEPVAPLDNVARSLQVKLQEQMFRANQEAITNRIFGSQLALLGHLSRQPGMEDKYVNMLQFYGMHKSQTSTPLSDLPTFLKFLFDLRLIATFEKNGEWIVSLTPVGVNYVSYVHGNFPNLQKSL